MVLLQLWPTAAIAAGFVVPFTLLLQVSVSHRDPAGLWRPSLELSNFAPLLDRSVLYRLGYTAVLALLVATLSSILAFPLASLVAGMRRRAQVAWLVLLLSTLSLSEVLVAFAWQVLLAKRIGLSAVLVWMRLIDEPQSLSPSFGAVLACLVYLVMPITAVLLFPGVTKLDRSLIEAAATMGASRRQVLTSVTLPLLRSALISAFLLAVVFTIGVYVTPLVLGPPEEWTFSALIGQAALSDGNLPLAAAMSLLLLAASVATTGATFWVGRTRAPAR